MLTEKSQNLRAEARKMIENFTVIYAHKERLFPCYFCGNLTLTSYLNGDVMKKLSDEEFHYLERYLQAMFHKPRCKMNPISETYHLREEMAGERPLMGCRFVWGTRTKRWHVVDGDDRDFAHGIDVCDFTGSKEQREAYLSPSIARA